MRALLAARRLVAVAAVAVLLAPGIAFAAPVSNFDDGTLQGWTKLLPFNGNLLNPGSSGNPGGFMKTEDTMAGGGSLNVIAPSAFSGNCSAYAGIAWDAYIYNCGTVVISPYPLLIGGPDNTIWVPQDQLARAPGAWHHRVAHFQESEWTCVSGSSSFATVLSDVHELQFTTEIGLNETCISECGLDNIRYLEALPAVSAQGLVALALLIALGGSLMLLRQRSSASV